MNRLLSFACEFFCLAFLFSAALHASEQDFRGKKILAIEYEPARQPVDPRDLQTMQVVQVGSPFDSMQLAATIDRLYASGLYDDIQVAAEPSGSGMTLRFITRPRRFIGHVGAIGQIKDPPSRSVILSDSQLTLGAPFDEDTLAMARKNVEQEMRENGLYQAQVTTATIEDPLTHQVTVRFLVTAGKRAKYEMPVINGQTKLSNSTIVRATGWRIPLIHRWRQVTSTLTDSGVEGIQKKYAKAGRLTTSVDLTSLEYDSTTGRAKPTIDINAGPKIKIRALEAKVSKGKLRQFVPVYQEGSVDNDLLTEGARNLHDYFQSKGYPDVDVTFKAEPPANDQEIINYYIATGPRRRLVNVQVEGSDYFTLTTIHERMFLKPKSVVLRYGRYSETFRIKDEEAIENLYEANGFRNVKVTSRVETNYKGKESDIGVVFKINQGPQWKVANLTIAGASRLDLSNVIRDRLTSAVGQPYADVNVASDRNFILEYYYSHGFASAAFKYATTPGDEPNTVNLTYTITEGPQEFVRQVVISGLRRTRPDVVQKRIDIKAGDPISTEKINDTARLFSNLGIFATVNTALQDADGTNRYKYVLYDFDEAARYTFNVGLGLEVGQFGNTTTSLAAASGEKGASPIVSFDVNRLNFRGVGETLSLQTRYSNIEQRESLNYIIPHFLGSLNRTATFSILYDTTQDVQTFSARREEVAVQTSQRLNRASTLLLRFAYRRDNPNVTLPVLKTPAFSGAVRLGILSASYIQDHRDNPADAHRGFWNTVDGGVAGNFFGSQRDYYRFLARNATYTPIGRNLVFARQTQIGGIIPFKLPAGFNSFDTIPLPERFFGGGGVSDRGFGDNQAGPRDIGTQSELPGSPTSTPTGFPIGGDGLFFNTFELRFPLLGPNISGVFFHDTGNIYSNFSDITLRYRQNGLQNFNYAVEAPGFGIRYRTPLGPVRVDFSYALNPTRYAGFSSNETVQQLVGCTAAEIGNPAFPNCDASPQRLSHFQFFFSIGQAF